MNLNWNTTRLYENLEDPKIKEDIKIIKHKISQLKEINFNSEENYIQKLETFLKTDDELENFTNPLLYSLLITSTDTENSEGIKLLNQVQELLADINVAFSTFKKFVSKVDISKAIAESKLCKKHEFILNEAKMNAKYALSEEAELVASKYALNGGNFWGELQNQLTSTLMVDIDLEGELKKLPLSEVRSMAHKKSEYLRKTAYHAELKAYPKIEKSIAAALNAIKGEAIQKVKLRGYESVLDMSLAEDRMDKKTLDALLGAMKESLPIFQKYFAHKAKLLGHVDGKLPFYDIAAPIGKNELKFSLEEACEFVEKNFTKFSDDLGSFVKNAFANDWVDWYPKEGKTDGAFCLNIKPIKESRVLMNFTSNFYDVTTLAHEFGHAYHNEALKNETALNSNYGMSIAETSSTFCETIVFNSALENANKSQKISILEANIAEAAAVIVDIYSRFLFEDSVIKRRENGSLSVDELKELMLDSQKQAYGSSLSCFHPYMWLCKSHYYEVNYNYYNFPYAYGLLFGYGLYSIYLEEGQSFAPKYKELLCLTGQKNLHEIGKVVGIDVQDINFWRKSLKVIEKNINEFLELA
ncbi:MAG: M3 family oligoendopeptidase [Defluviitaleaceae bacterium]|nr:M3 family oligoendopeptidase [Defluviitaleaceae bacterium]